MVIKQAIVPQETAAKNVTVPTILPKIGKMFATAFSGPTINEKPTHVNTQPPTRHNQGIIVFSGFLEFILFPTNEDGILRRCPVRRVARLGGADRICTKELANRAPWWATKGIKPKADVKNALQMDYDVDFTRKLACSRVRESGK